MFPIKSLLGIEPLARVCLVLSVQLARKPPPPHLKHALPVARKSCLVRSFVPLVLVVLLGPGKAIIFTLVFGLIIKSNNERAEGRSGSLREWPRISAASPVPLRACGGEHVCYVRDWLSSPCHSLVGPSEPTSLMPIFKVNHGQTGGQLASCFVGSSPARLSNAIRVGARTSLPGAGRPLAGLTPNSSSHLRIAASGYGAGSNWTWWPSGRLLGASQSG